MGEQLGKELPLAAAQEALEGVPVFMDAFEVMKIGEIGFLLNPGNYSLQSAEEYQEALSQAQKAFRFLEKQAGKRFGGEVLERVVMELWANYTEFREELGRRLGATQRSKPLVM